MTRPQSGAQRSWLPHPGLSAALLVFWLWLNSSLAFGQIVLGSAAALAIPWFTTRFWSEQVPLRKPVRLAFFMALVLRDIVVANVVVAVRILGPNRNLSPSFVTVPVELESDFALVTLASVISLTPGTVSTDLSPDRRTLLIHALTSTNDEALVETIKRRYERPLAEIFEC